MTSFIHDDSAIMEIPIRLLVYIILTAAIVAIAAVGMKYLEPGRTSDIMEKQIGEMKVSMKSMQSGSSRNLIDTAAPTGNIRTYKLTIPDDAEYLSFGVDPDPENDHNLTNTPYGNLTENGNVIYYRSRTGGKARIPLESSIELREGSLENGRWILKNGKQYGVVLHDPGMYIITFELVYDPVMKERYTLIHLTDDLNAYINPYYVTVFPNNIWISVNPDSIPADGITEAQVTVRLKDKKMQNAGKAGVKINISATLGNVSLTSLVTDEKGMAGTVIRSNLTGTAVISAISPGLNQGFAYLTITQVPILLAFGKWINDSEPLIAQFSTDKDHEYSVDLSAHGIRTLWEWPVARIEIDGMVIGEATIDSENIIVKPYNQTILPAGNHTVSIRMTNDFYVPFIWDRNLFVESVLLS